MISKHIFAFLTCMALPTIALAQQTAAPDEKAVAAARVVVAKMQGDKTAVLQSMSAPMSAMLAQIGIREPEKAQVIVNEVVLPTLTAHYDQLIDMQARSYAGVLSASDLAAISAFYDTPAGRNFATAQPRLAQAQLTGITQWMGALAPEMQTKIVAAVQKHGWDAPPRK